MKGKNKFTNDEINKVRQLIAEKCRADSSKQKVIRAKLRNLDFYISDYTDDMMGFTCSDLDMLLENGNIMIVDSSVYDHKNKNSTINKSIVSNDGLCGNTIVRLIPFLRPGLDVLFVALNPPVRSNSNSHYFSGSYSRFYYLLWLSGLIEENIDNDDGDDRIFGDNSINYKHSQYGVVDIVTDVVETNSNKVVVSKLHVVNLIESIKRLKPKIVCIIHSKVKAAINSYGEQYLNSNIDYGLCGRILKGSDSFFVMNYFPNGNSIPDDKKIKIFKDMRALI